MCGIAQNPLNFLQHTGERMNSIEFKALAKGNDLTRVMISSNRNSGITVSAILICDNDSQPLTAYNSLSDDEGHLVKFENIYEAEKAIRSLGYKGVISASGSDVKKLMVKQNLQ